MFQYWRNGGGVTQTITALARRHPRLVIIASSSTTYVDENRFVFVDPNTQARARTTAARARLWSEGLTLVLARLHAAGVPAIVVHTIPHFGSRDLVSCPEYRIARGLTSCGRSRDRSAVAAEQSAALGAERAAVAAVPGTRDVDFTPALCSPTTCATNNESFFMFRDYAHLSVAGAMRLEPAFERLLRPSLPR